MHLKFTALLLLLPSLLFASERSELIKILADINSSKQILTSETQKWESEKQTLNLQLSLLKKALTEDNQSAEALADDLLKLKKSKAELETAISQQSDILKKANEAADKHLKKLQSISKQIPNGLQPLISKEQNLLRDASLNPNAELLDKLSVAGNFTTALLQLQKKNHRVKEIILADGKEFEATVIYIGTYRAFYINNDHSLAGKITFSNGSWEAMSDNSLKGSVLQAIDQMDRKGAPALVSLPLGGDK